MVGAGRVDPVLIADHFPELGGATGRGGHQGSVAREVPPTLCPLPQNLMGVGGGRGRGICNPPPLGVLGGSGLERGQGRALLGKSTLGCRLVYGE